MIDLRVPTVDTSVQILRADGQEMAGRIFLPAVAETHEGPVRIEEWANDAADFFPFHADGEAAPVILGKASVLAFGFEATGEAPVLEIGGLSMRNVTVECGAHRFTGTVVIDLPDANQRVLDYMNQPLPFLRLRAGGRESLIQKRFITRVAEEGQ